MNSEFDSNHMARTSSTAKSARNWDFARIQKFTDSEQISDIEMLEDRSLYVSFTPVPVSPKYNNVPIIDCFIVEPSASSYLHFLEISGLSQPGQHKSFKKPRPPEAIWKVEELLYYLETDCVLSVEYTQSEFVEIELRGFFQKESAKYPLSLNSDQAKLMLEKAGIKSHGEKVYFPKAQEKFKEFLRTGEEPRGKSL